QHNVHDAGQPGPRRPLRAAVRRLAGRPPTPPDRYRQRRLEPGPHRDRARRTPDDRLRGAAGRRATQRAAADLGLDHLLPVQPALAGRLTATCCSPIRQLTSMATGCATGPRTSTTTRSASSAPAESQRTNAVRGLPGRAPRSCVVLVIRSSGAPHAAGPTTVAAGGRRAG